MKKVFLTLSIMAIVSMAAFFWLVTTDEDAPLASPKLNAAEYQKFSESCEKDRTSQQAFANAIAATGGTYERSPADLQHLEQELVKVLAGMTTGEVEKFAGPPNYAGAVWSQGETLVCEWTYVYAGKSGNDGFVAAKKNVIGFNGEGRVVIPPSGPWTTINR